MSITAADILAALDVLFQAQEESDDMSFDLAIELRAASRELARQAKKTADLLEMEMLRQVEDGPKMVGTVNYFAVNDNKTTWDHDRIESDVVARAKEAALDRQTGEFVADEAARQAADMMRQIYVSPSTTAKMGALSDLGVDIPTVRQRERKGRKLHEVDTQAED